MRYGFFALISRMKNITRWSLMRNTTAENVQEHSLMVAVIAHALAVIRRDVFGKEADPGAVAAAALFHDAGEIFTGDMPTPIKYFDPAFIKSYKKIEAVASDKLLLSLPEAMRRAYMPLLAADDKQICQMVKAADKIAAYIKCLEEIKSGNNEFKNAAEQTLGKLREMDMREIEYFIEHFIPAFGLTLDELEFSFEREKPLYD